jgi:hypothetical protein
MAAANRGSSAQMHAVSSAGLLLVMGVVLAVLAQCLVPTAAAAVPYALQYSSGMSAVGNRPPMDPSLVHNIKVKLLKPAAPQASPIPAVINLGVDPSTGEPLKLPQTAPTSPKSAPKPVPKPFAPKLAAPAAGVQKPQPKLTPHTIIKTPSPSKKPGVVSPNLQPPATVLKGLLNLFNTTATPGGSKSRIG